MKAIKLCRKIGWTGILSLWVFMVRAQTYSLVPYYNSKVLIQQIAACGDTVFFVTNSGAGLGKIYKTAGTSLDSIQYKFYQPSSAILNISSRNDTLYASYQDFSDYRRTYKFYHSIAVDSSVVWTHNFGYVYSMTTDSLNNIYEITGYSSKDSLVVLNSSMKSSLKVLVSAGRYNEITVHNGNIYFGFWSHTPDSVHERSGATFGIDTKLFTGWYPYYNNDTIYYVSKGQDSLQFQSVIVQDTGIGWITASSSGVFAAVQSLNPITHIYHYSIKRLNKATITGIANPTLGIDVLLYPNPNNGKFSVRVNGQAGRATMRIFNLLGSEVYNGMLNGAGVVDMHNEPSGIYLYRIISGDGENQGTGKFVIQ